MIAILMATYNGEKYLGEQIDSILNQTYTDFVCYIHDDGSKDNTNDVINRYCREYPDKIARLEGPPAGGSKANFLYLLRNVEADYYMFADQDDFWLPEKIEKSFKAIVELAPSSDIPKLVFSDMSVVDSELNILNPSFVRFSGFDVDNLYFNRLLCQNVVAGCTTIFNRKLRDLSLNYKTEANVRWHDWWLALIAVGAGRISFVDEPLSMYRQHNDNCLGAVKERGFDINRLKRYAKNILTFSQVKQTKERIRNFIVQAQELKWINLAPENEEIINELQCFYKVGKLKRIKLFIKYKIKRNARNTWQLICL